jgi:hypothetical protein
MMPLAPSLRTSSQLLMTIVVGARDQLVAQLEQRRIEEQYWRALVGALHGAQGVVLVVASSEAAAAAAIAGRRRTARRARSVRWRGTGRRTGATTRPMPAGMNLGSVPSCATTFSTAGADVGASASMPQHSSSA